MMEFLCRYCKLSALVLGCFLFCDAARAQYVAIPDTAFASWLHSNGFATCMNGNQLDTTCSVLLNATSLNCNAVPIRDLTGVQYFKNITSLDCSNDSIESIPAFPSMLSSINCDYNRLYSIPALPAVLEFLACGANFINSLPDLPSTLLQLNCDENQLATLPVLPGSLKELTCSNNLFDSLPATLPDSLQTLECSYDQLSSIPPLPSTLQFLFCSNNYLSSLPNLPPGLINLSCDNNMLTGLPVLPQTLKNLVCNSNILNNLPGLPLSLQDLNCNQNQLSTIPSLPSTLQQLLCQTNQVRSLPTLPSGLWYLECGGNLLDSLPVLPASLQILSCPSNNIINIPILPDSVNFLDVSVNQLSSLPSMPDSLGFLNCSNNPNLSCLPRFKIVGNLWFNGTAITCLPDYGTVGSSIPSLNTIPLCGSLNPGGCGVYSNISGNIFYDANSNCVFDSTDVEQAYVKIQLDSGGIVQQQVFSGGAGDYSFMTAGYGNYTVQPDISNLPFMISCPDTGYFTAAITPVDSLSYGNNFALICHTFGFDLGVQSILNNYIIPRPATTFTLNAIVGDMSELYGAHCAAGVSGQVQLVYSGQVSYKGATSGSLIPSVISGDTLTWNIADFGNINDYNSFNTLFVIDSSASVGSQICFTINVSPSVGDLNPANNTGNYCFTVVNSLDPNEKEVYPKGNTDTSNLWLVYTIRFQNTGSAAAVNIRITDTLDNNLDPSTFQLLAFSAKNITQLTGNAAVFYFPAINLPDSAVSDSASRGYVQYKIKLKDNLPLGTEIKNSADIYFDLNRAVITDTTINTISLTASISQITSEISFKLYPNPSKNYVSIETDESAIGAMVQLTDIAGRELEKLQITSSAFRISTSALGSGVYLVKVSDSRGRSAVKKLVVE